MGRRTLIGLAVAALAILPFTALAQTEAEPQEGPGAGAPVELKMQGDPDAAAAEAGTGPQDYRAYVFGAYALAFVLLFTFIGAVHVRQSAIERKIAKTGTGTNLEK